MLTVIPKFEANTEQIEDEEIAEVIRLFQRTDFPFRVLVLEQVPNLNLILHDLNLPIGNVQSVWDDIQDVQGHSGLPISFDDLTPPEGMTVFYSWPSVFFDDNNNTHRQQVRFHRRGFVNQITEFLPDGSKVSQYDFRGFVTYTDWLDLDKNELKREWYTATGDLVMTRQAGSIQIAPAYTERFDKSTYENTDEIVSEFIQKYLGRYPKNQILSHKRPFVTERIVSLDRVDRVFYLSGYREIVNDSIDFRLGKKDYYVLPTTVDLEMFQEKVGSLEENRGVALDKRLAVIPLYPTELDIGVSNELALMNIYWYWGDYPTETAVQLMARLLAFFGERDDLAIQAEVSGDADIDELSDTWEQMVAAFFDLNTEDETYQKVKLLMIARREKKFSPFSKKQIEELRKNERFDDIATAIEVVFRFAVLKPQTRDAQNELVTNARVYLDTGELPNLRLQTASISSGIPQITQRSRGMLEDGLTGIIATTQEEIMAALHHYLDNLRPWNEALVENVRLLEQYQESYIIQEWEELSYGEER